MSFHIPTNVFSFLNRGHLPLTAAKTVAPSSWLSALIPAGCAISGVTILALSRKEVAEETEKSLGGKVENALSNIATEASTNAKDFTKGFESTFVPSTLPPVTEGTGEMPAGIKSAIEYGTINLNAFHDWGSKHWGVGHATFAKNVEINKKKVEGIAATLGTLNGRIEAIETRSSEFSNDVLEKASDKGRSELENQIKRLAAEHQVTLNATYMELHDLLDKNKFKNLWVNSPKNAASLLTRFNKEEQDFKNALKPIQEALVAHEKALQNEHLMNTLEASRKAGVEAGNFEDADLTPEAKDYLASDSSYRFTDAGNRYLDTLKSKIKAVNKKQTAFNQAYAALLGKLDIPSVPGLNLTNINPATLDNNKEYLFLMKKDETSVTAEDITDLRVLAQKMTDTRRKLCEAKDLLLQAMQKASPSKAVAVNKPNYALLPPDEFSEPLIKHLRSSRFVEGFADEHGQPISANEVKGLNIPVDRSVILQVPPADLATQTDKATFLICYPEGDEMIRTLAEIPLGIGGLVATNLAPRTNNGIERYCQADSKEPALSLSNRDWLLRRLQTDTSV